MGGLFKKKGRTRARARKNRGGQRLKEWRRRTFLLEISNCCIHNCPNKSESLVLTRLPDDPQKRKEWINRIKTPKWKPSKNSGLCQIHFEEDAWENDAAGVKVLKANVVPTLFLDNESDVEEDSLVRPSTSGETNNEAQRNSVFIKEEPMDSDIDISKAANHVDEHFETVYLSSGVVEDTSEHLMTIKAEPQDMLEGTIVPELKTESIDIVDVADPTQPPVCQICGQSFHGDLQQHILENHRIKGSSADIPRKPEDPSVNHTLNREVTAKKCTCPHPQTTPSVQPIIVTPVNPKYLVLASQAKMPVATPPTPKYSVDASELFSVSLAHLSEPTRVAVKKKMLEVLEMVENSNINPELIIIARKA